MQTNNIQIWQKPSHNYALDFVKTVATIFIVFHHYQQITGVDEPIAFGGGLFYWGYMVELFFLLSGYLVFRYVPLIYKKKISLKIWYSKRAFRLLPLVTVSCIVYEILLYINNNTFSLNYLGLSVSVWGTVLAALGLNEGGAFANPMVNNAVWYVAVLLICYVAMYLVTRIAQMLKTSPFPFYVAMCLLGCSILLSGMSFPYLQSQTARGYCAFFFGLLLGGYIKKHGIGRKEICFSLVTILLFAFFYWFDYTLVIYDIRYILIFLLFPSIIMLAESSVSKKIFTSPIWGKIGAIQFSVYLWHSPFLLVGFMIISVHGITLDYSNILYMLIFTLIVELFSVASYYYIEKPLARYTDKLIRKMEAEEISDASLYTE